MKIRISGLLILALLLCLFMPAYAEQGQESREDPAATENRQDAEGTSAEELSVEALSSEEEVFSVLRSEELDAILEELITENQLNRDDISVAFYYSGTGEAWYYNESAEYYSASLYKVPLLMSVTDLMDSDPTLTWDTEIKNYPLLTIAEYVVKNSNNEFAHMLMDHFWPDNTQCRKLWPAYAGLEVSQMSSDFINLSYFNVYFMNNSMRYLYENSEKYAVTLDFLKQAQPKDYFNLKLKDSVEVAQKYGSYETFRHTSGIIYTEHPIIITIMTLNSPMERVVSGSFAEKMTAYGNLLDQRLDAHTAELEEAARLEEEQKAAEEAARLEEEQRAAAEAAAVPEAEATVRQTDTEAETTEEQTLIRTQENETPRLAAILALCLSLAAVLGMELRTGRKRR